MMLWVFLIYLWVGVFCTKIDFIPHLKGSLISDGVEYPLMYWPVMLTLRVLATVLWPLAWIDERRFNKNFNPKAPNE